VVQPTTDDQVSEFFGRLTVTHTMRWHAHYETGGTGHLYQGRFKSFPVEESNYLLTSKRSGTALCEDRRLEVKHGVPKVPDTFFLASS
jgi:hypothetical protein